LGDSDKIRVGESVIAISNPFGYSHARFAAGLSAKAVIVAGPALIIYQTDASINGNSGE